MHAKTVKVSCAPQAREKYVKATRGAKNPALGVGHAVTVYCIHSSGSHTVCTVVHARVRDRECDGHACASVRRALARPERKLVKVAPGYLRKRVKVASQRDRHKMVKVSEGAENIPPPYACAPCQKIRAVRAVPRPRRAGSLLVSCRCAS